MRLPMMNIEYIHWPAIPVLQHSVLLNNIRVGEYVYSLPVDVPNGAKEMIFPLPPSFPPLSSTCQAPPLDKIYLNEMRFRRETYTDGVDKVDVWKRVT